MSIQTSPTETQPLTQPRSKPDAQPDPNQLPVVPMLTYVDGPAALDWLEDAFGFVTVDRWLDQRGDLAHGTMNAFGGLVMLASTIDGYESPRMHRTNCARANDWLQSPYVIDGVLVHVPDVAAHRQRAVAAGARALSEVEDAGPIGRLYRVEDLEGHRWMFLQRSS